GGAEQSRTTEIEQRPQVAEMVLDGCAGQHEPAASSQLLDRACLRGSGILDRLSLVEHDQGPAWFLEPGLPPSQAVRRHDEIVLREGGSRSVGDTAKVIGGAFRAMGEEDTKRRAEARQLL